MSERFVIQEIVTQDWSGVLFRAIDLESGNAVGLHRFFPFGLAGVEAEGLFGDEREEYRAGVQEIAEMRHPAFRTVITGGCDPVDGVPFVVTEWIEGESLAQMMEKGPLEAEAAFELFNQALLVCEAISGKLGSEALWLSMLPELIVLDQGKQARGFTFGLSPNRWLVDSRERRSLKPAANLLDYVMGWTGRLVVEQMGGGLGGWVKWLRGPGQASSLAEARMMLSRMTGHGPDTPAVQPPAAAPPSTPMTVPNPPPTPPAAPSPTLAPPSKTPSAAPSPPRPAAVPSRVPPASPPAGKGMWIIMALLVLAIGGVLAWVILRPGAGDGSGTAKPRPAAARTEADRASARAAELAKQVEKGEISAITDVSETDVILGQKGLEMTVEGEVTALDKSESGKAFFLVFRNAVAKGRVEKAKAAAGLTEEALKKFVGKRIRLTGKVSVPPGGKPVITFTSLSAIKEAP